MTLQLPENRVLLPILAAVIVAAVAVGGWGVSQAVRAPQAPKPSEPTFPFLCDKCGALFDQPRSALSDETFAAMNSPQGAAIDCPKCGAKSSAYMPTRCPACGKHYISDSARGLPPSSDRPARCPHCGVDPVVWQIQHVKPEI